MPLPIVSVGQLKSNLREPMRKTIELTMNSSLEKEADNPVSTEHCKRPLTARPIARTLRADSGDNVEKECHPHVQIQECAIRNGDYRAPSQTREL